MKILFKIQKVVRKRWPISLNVGSTISAILFSGKWVNSLASGKFEWNFRYLIFQIISVIDGWVISCELASRWMSLNLADDKSTLVQVMAWCCQIWTLNSGDAGSWNPSENTWRIGLHSSPQHYCWCMMTSSNGNIFRVTGHLCGEFTSEQWISRTKDSDAELWCFLWSTPWINGSVTNCEANALMKSL